MKCRSIKPPEDRFEQMGAPGGDGEADPAGASGEKSLLSGGFSADATPSTTSEAA
jgi:hypothetical protein